MFSPVRAALSARTPAWSPTCRMSRQRSRSASRSGQQLPLCIADCPKRSCARSCGDFSSGGRGLGGGRALQAQLFQTGAAGSVASPVSHDAASGDRSRHAVAGEASRAINHDSLSGVIGRSTTTGHLPTTWPRSSMMRYREAVGRNDSIRCTSLARNRRGLVVGHGVPPHQPIALAILTVGRVYPWPQNGGAGRSAGCGANETMGVSACSRPLRLTPGAWPVAESTASPACRNINRCRALRVGCSISTWGHLPCRHMCGRVMVSIQRAHLRMTGQSPARSTSHTRRTAASILFALVILVGF